MSPSGVGLRRCPNLLGVVGGGMVWGSVCCVICLIHATDFCDSCLMYFGLRFAFYVVVLLAGAPDSCLLSVDVRTHDLAC